MDNKILDIDTIPGEYLCI